MNVAQPIHASVASSKVIIKLPHTILGCIGRWYPDLSESLTCDSQEQCLATTVVHPPRSCMPNDLSDTFCLCVLLCHERVKHVMVCISGI